MHQFFWPDMLQKVQRFVQNCNVCEQNKVWRERKQSFLKSLSLSEQLWSEISIDFIVKLLLSKSCMNITVITDQLRKGVILKACSDITADSVTQLFVQSFYWHHKLSKVIVSDRGSQFIEALWTRVCEILKIEWRLSTAYHPQTDSSTERANETLETYLHTFINHAQDDWSGLLSIAELTINNWDSVSIEVSPFFLSHEYHCMSVEVSYEKLKLYSQKSSLQKVNSIIWRLKETEKWAQSAMTISQQEQEEMVNQMRQQITAFKMRDKIWLDLRNVHTTQPSKKLDDKHAKYTVTEMIGSHSFCLNTLSGIHNVFHSDKLHLTASDPFLSQQTDDSHPPPEIINGEEKYEIEKILEHCTRRRGRRNLREYLMKWSGYVRLTWEPVTLLKNTAVLTLYEDEQ